MIFPSIIIEGDYQTSLEKILQELKSLSLRNNPDIFVVDQNSGWGIDVTKSIIHFFSQKPITQPSKICLIYQAENLTTEAQNALLKTLEEPPPLAHLILLTSNHHQLLDTIISRSHLISNITQDHSSSPPLTPPKNIGQALDFSLKIQEVINKDELPTWLDQQIEIFHRQLPQPPSSKIISTLIHAKQMHRANVESKAIIDWIFLSLISH